MATNTLTARSSGETITDSFFNDIHSAVQTQLVGRNSSGVPTSGQSLGTAALPWGTLYTNGLVVNGSSVDTTQVSAPSHRVVSGKVRTTSNQPAYLTPAGSAGGSSVTVAAATTNLVVTIGGTAVTITADIAKGSLTTAPSTNNTALVNDTDAADQEATRIWGEQDAERNITIDTAGSEITSLVGTWQAFKINDGTNDEYFWAFVESSTLLSKAFRGFFYDDSLDPVNRIKFANNDTITLMKANYLFIDSDGTTVDATTTVPAYSDTAPSSPSTGDYWFDIPNSLWKRYDGATFQTVTRTYIGMAICDDTDCLVARCVDFDARYKIDNTVQLDLTSTEIVRGRGAYQKINVAGNEIFYGTDRATWNITVDLATSADMYNASEQSSTRYYLYIKDDGGTVISDISPYQRADLAGFYHPHNPWRCVGFADNDGSSDLVEWDQFLDQLMERNEESVIIVSSGAGNSGNGSTDTGIREFSQTDFALGKDLSVTTNSTNGTVVTVNTPGLYYMVYAEEKSAGGSAQGISINSTALTAFNPLSLNEGISYAIGASATPPGVWIRHLKKGDKIRCHSSSGDGSTQQNSNFQVRRIIL